MVEARLSPTEFTQALQTRRSAIQAGLRERSDRALANAESHLRALETGTDVEGSSRVFSDALETALGDARQTETQLWKKIIPNRFVGMGPIHAKINEIEAGLTKAQRADPTIKRELARYKNLIFKTYRGAENVNELIGSGGLRSQLLEKKRNFASGDTPNSTMEHISGQLAEAVLDALQAQAKTQTGAVNVLRIDEAREFSRMLNGIIRS